MQENPKSTRPRRLPTQIQYKEGFNLRGIKGKKNLFTKKDEENYKKRCIQIEAT